jgi:recombination protein RecA
MTPPKTKPSTLAGVLADIRAEQNTTDHMVIGSLPEFDMTVKGYSTGNIALDWITRTGGYPHGRIVEQFGPPSSGKTTSALSAMGREQALCIEADEGYVMFEDFERSIDPEYCQKLGLDVGHPSFIYVKPDSFEHGANLFRRLLATGELRMCIFDSVAAMVTEKEKESETGKANVADRAKMMHQFLRQTKDDAERYGTTMIFLNHHLQVVDATPMGQKLAARGIKQFTQPGGKALSFYASMRIEFKPLTVIRTAEMDALTNRKEDQVRQQDVQATIVKNKTGDPFGTAKLRVRWGHGFSNEYSVLDILTKHGAVDLTKQGWYTFPADLAPDGKQYKSRGEDSTISKIEDNPEWSARLTAYAQMLLEQSGGESVDGSQYDNDGNIKVDDLDALLDVSLDDIDEETGEVLV